MHLSPRSCISLSTTAATKQRINLKSLPRHWSLRRTIPRNPEWWKVPLATVFLLKTNRKPICGPDFRAAFFCFKGGIQKRRCRFSPLVRFCRRQGEYFFVWKIQGENRRRNEITRCDGLWPVLFRLQTAAAHQEKLCDRKQASLKIGRARHPFAMPPAFMGLESGKGRLLHPFSIGPNLPKSFW